MFIKFKIHFIMKRFSCLTGVALALSALLLCACNENENENEGNGESPLSNEWCVDGDTRTQIVNVATEEKAGLTYFYLNNNVPQDEESQYTVQKKIILALPTEEMGCEFKCTADNREAWRFEMVDADRKVEMRDGSGGTIEISSNNGNVVIQGSMQYENATVDLEYTGAVTDLSTFNDSEHSGSGKMKWSFETEPMTISATCYKYLRFKEGDMYLIFLYCGGEDHIPLEKWTFDEYSKTIHDQYNYEGVLIFIPAAFVAEGKTVDLTQTQEFASFTEHRLPWAITGMFGNVELPDGSWFSKMFYGFEDKNKLGAAPLNYNLIQGASMQITKKGSEWNIVLNNIARDTDEGREKVLSGEYHGSMESWSEHAFTEPWMWLDCWLLFDENQ